MAIEKPLTPVPSFDDFKDEADAEISIEVTNPDAVSVETEDGGMVIDFTG